MFKAAAVGGGGCGAAAAAGRPSPACHTMVPGPASTRPAPEAVRGRSGRKIVRRRCAND